ncbi:peptide chain release factor N(5)-glutamine methyltransferase [Vibrio sp. 10N.222.51.C8]|jgi:release factor glutamine methyltransferase|uniref:peptide chain release factor N(5)-glutamine methyltransferase n=1 Tax=Vibrio TaxID=662 RepID=UPI0002FA6ECE|nr:MULTISPECIES: peptide chain release factor N(5)-glutamine methyltransferase [Vibrio]ANP77275.1 protein-(glutamine-N5) methyltransferase, release factor-specific [Vibrio crassostreae 9CS106]OCH52938.1 protein-(glutamine-N5) methyltransferase, release factor-specific [Vibrio sp. ZF57]OED76138.1 protein-(glutamine-N5) methyltransferase, release factor-specific [Vibrio crassostreae ZF-91]OEE99262.1 protein-(glutamine-N5) methyltransferase, release factor-specific [Vibrio crassostreae 9ZC13]OEF0
MQSAYTVESALKAAIVKLQEGDNTSPSIDAAVLLCHALDKPRSYLLTWPEKHLTSEQESEFNALLKRRLTGEPVAYIIGEREFWSLPLKVSPSTLIPRPDTERLVEVALDKTFGKQGAILDLGTGTGAIALALASEMPNRQVTGIDLRPEAQQLATENAQRLNITNATFLHGSWFEPLSSEGVVKFSLIVSNPPYIEKNDPHLSQGDVRFEPITALVAEEKGLADIRYISENARGFLENEGWLAFEHGYDQGLAVREIMQALGYLDVVTEKDYGGNDRVTLGRYCS